MRPDCPYRGELLAPTRNHALIRARNRLRRQLRGCASCRRGSACRVQARWRAEVDAAIDRLHDEWGLSR